MILVLLAISVVLFVVCVVVGFLYTFDDVEGIICAIGTFIMGCAVFACVITAIVLGVKNSSEKALNSKIEIYQEENTRLEQSIDDIAKNYLQYETEAYEQFKNDSSTVLIQLFPELKSNELIAKQMEIVQSNNAQIKEIKSKIADLATVKWWLYFGG